MATAFTVSVYFRMSSPYVPCISRPAIHHNDVTSVSRPMRRGHADARRRIDLALDQPRVDDPEHRPHADEDQHESVDSADHLHDEREDRGIRQPPFAQAPCA